MKNIGRSSFLLLLLLTGCVSTDDPDLIYHCTFDSREACLKPAVGPCGSLFADCTFVEGKEGQALRVPPNNPLLSIPLEKGFLKDRGRIEFWAKIENTNDFIRDGGDPRFFCIKYENRSEVLIDFNSNNGGGNSGLHAMLPGFNLTSSQGLKLQRYSEIFRGTDWQAWHHYALVWDSQGIKKLNGTQIAVLVDGTPLPMHGANGLIDQRTLADLSATLDIPRNPTNGIPMNNRSPYLIDDLKIWKSAW